MVEKCLSFVKVNNKLKGAPKNCFLHDDCVASWQKMLTCSEYGEISLPIILFPRILGQELLTYMGIHPNEYPSEPRAAVAALVRRNDKILVVLRGNPPAEETWALPGGSIELGETIYEAAERETLEETGVRVRAIKPLTAVDAIYRDEDGAVRFHYVIVYMLASLISGEPAADDDVKDARWMTLEELEEYMVEKKTLEILKGLLSG